MWVAAPARFDHVFRVSLQFGQCGGSDFEKVDENDLVLAQWPSWLCERAEEIGVQLPPSKRTHSSGVCAGDEFHLLGLVKLTRRGAQYYTGPASQFTNEGASECRRQINTNESITTNNRTSTSVHIRNKHEERNTYRQLAEWR